MTTKALTTPMGQHLAAQARHAWASGLEAIVASDEELLAVEQQAAQAERERLEVAVKSLTVYRGLRKRIVLDLADVLSVFVIEGKEPE